MNKFFIFLFSILIISSCTQTDYEILDAELRNGNNIINSGLYIPLANSNQKSSETQIIALTNLDTYQITADIVQYEIDGTLYSMFAYNKMIPGPILKVKKGSSLKVDFKNNLDQETTIHWHGLRQNIKDDGVPGFSQEPVKSGEKYTYTLSFPDAGIFWYHPHVREDLQQDLGLYGNIIVYDEYEKSSNIFNREEYLAIDDILINDHRIAPYGSKNANFALMGRYGNIMLINGKIDYELKVNKGDVVRFYLTNTANVRPFNIMFGGSAKIVGSDLGMFEKEEFVDSVIISPGERYIVDVYFENSGEYAISNYNPETTFLTTLGKIIAEDKKSSSDFSKRFFELKNNENVINEIQSYKKYFDKKIDYNLDLTLDMQGMMNMENMHSGMQNMPCHQMPDGSMMGDCDVKNEKKSGIEWEDGMRMMNTMMNSDMVKWIIKDKNTGKENMDLKMNAKVGDIIKIRLFNNPNSMHPMQHPIHLHGQRFLVLEKDGIQNKNLVWKDTVLVPAGSTIDILVDVTNPGEWMLHCHIAEHLTSGMMTIFYAEEGT